MSSRSFPEAWLLEGLRTPFGRYRGQLAALDSLQLGEHVIRALLARHAWAHQLDAAPIDAVLMGVVVQAGLGQNPARIAATRAGVPLSTPALTLNSVCLASLEAVCEATRRIRLGEGGCYLVGGFDSMSRGALLCAEPDQQALNEQALSEQAPISAVMHDGLSCALSGRSMGALSDTVNAQLGITRAAQDAWALRSQQRALRASRSVLAEEIAPLRLGDQLIAQDQGIRTDTSAERLAALRPAFSETGTITAGNASQMADGASAGWVVDTTTLKRSGLPPLARIVDWAAVAGPDTSLHLKPFDAVARLLRQQGLQATDIALYEINEAFAGVALASTQALGISPDRVNVNGGAVALGHPLGATGFRLLLTLALELRRRQARRGIACLCGGGGQGLAVLIENAAWASSSKDLS